MLKKLIKYDLQKMLKLLVYFYAIAIGIAIIARILSIWENIQFIGIIKDVFVGMEYSAIATVLINMFIHIIMRFKENFYKDESYLTHTLPVTKNQLLLSKYLSALIVVLLSVLCCVLSLFITFYSPELMMGLKMAITQLVTDLNISSGLFLTLIVLIIFVELCSLLSMSFTAIIKGNMYNTNRTLKGVLWCIAYYFVTMLATFIIVLLFNVATGNVATLFGEVMSQSVFLSVIIISLVCYLIATILFYLFAKRLFNKGVNVD